MKGISVMDLKIYFSYSGEKNMCNNGGLKKTFKCEICEIRNKESCMH